MTRDEIAAVVARLMETDPLREDAPPDSGDATFVAMMRDRLHTAPDEPRHPVIGPTDTVPEVPEIHPPFGRLCFVHADVEESGLLGRKKKIDGWIAFYERAAVHASGDTFPWAAVDTITFGRESLDLTADARVLRIPPAAVPALMPFLDDQLIPWVAGRYLATMRDGDGIVFRFIVPNEAMKDGFSVDMTTEGFQARTGWVWWGQYDHYRVDSMHVHALGGGGGWTYSMTVVAKGHDDPLGCSVHHPNAAAFAQILSWYENARDGAAAVLGRDRWHGGPHVLQPREAKSLVRPGGVIAGWIEEMRDFLSSTLAAKQAYKRSMGGRLSDSDALDYSDEEVGCRKAIEALESLRNRLGGLRRLDRGVLVKRAKAALEAVEHRHTRRGGRSKGITWAIAVVEGDPEPHYNHYHPRRGRGR